jgi:hypothetical protein
MAYEHRDPNIHHETKIPIASDLLEIKTVGPNTISAISIMGEKEQLAGNVLRRLCKLGGEACAKECQLHRGLIDLAQASIDAKCADDNLVQVINELGTRPERVFMVGVTADNIGFADEVDTNPDKYPYKINPNTGVKELVGFNAFFAREGDTVAGDELDALGRRLADCGDINIEFTDQHGKKVMGFMHMTKPNLQGEGAVKYEYDGQEVGSFEYFLRTAVEHYGADLSSVEIRVAAAIKPEHYIYRFTEEAKIDEHFPGWKTMRADTGEPIIRNINNPDWQPGQPFNPGDKWEGNFPAMIKWQMAQVTELKPEQINWEDAIDAGDRGNQHASNHRGYADKTWSGRDAYFTVWFNRLNQDARVD